MTGPLPTGPARMLAPSAMTPSTRSLQHGLYLGDGDSDCVSNAIVRKFTPRAKPVDGGWTHSQDLRDLPHGEKLAHGLRHFVVRR